MKTVDQEEAARLLRLMTFFAQGAMDAGSSPA